MNYQCQSNTPNYVIKMQALKTVYFQEMFYEIIDQCLVQNVKRLSSNTPYPLIANPPYSPPLLSLPSVKMWLLQLPLQSTQCLHLSVGALPRSYLELVNGHYSSQVLFSHRQIDKQTARRQMNRFLDRQIVRWKIRKANGDRQIC